MSNIADQFNIVKKRQTGQVFSDITGTWMEITDREEIEVLLTLKSYAKRKGCDKRRLKKAAIQAKAIFAEKHGVQAEASTEKEEDKPEINLKKIATDTLQKLIDFFSEFSFEPNYRFVNTLTRFANRSSEQAIGYIKNYFALTDNSYAMSIIEKMKSIEFKEICDNLKQLQTDRKINDRFKLYYGSQGTGKTTKALEEAKGKCMVCHSAMLPSDLMEDFKFKDGNPAFEPSILQKSMVNGEVIVLDEINLLPFESLRFLQSVLDGKKEFIYKGKTIKIKDGFKIIGTMNLVVNGCTYALPEPLIDRCEDIQEFKLTASMLTEAIL